MSYVTRADLGGQAGHGAVRPEAEGDLFHAAWELRALAVTLAMGATGAWNIDASRAARETLPAYADLGYYAIWVNALQVLLTSRGLVQAEELADGRLREPGRALPRCLAAGDVAAALAKGSPTERPASRAARFTVGDRVRTRAAASPHHSRLPAYARGQVGCIERVHGVHVFAEANAQGLGEQAQWLYTVVFEAAALWGGSDEGGGGSGGDGGGATVAIDAWEPSLESA